MPNAARQDGWNVYDNGRWIDKVFFNSGMSADDVKRALVGHDGYAPSITVRKEKNNNA